MAVNMFAALMTRKSTQQKLAKALMITTPNGIVNERFVKIGGIDQWITIRGEDRRNPVLFFVHGGPGSTYSIFAPLLRSWEKYFTLVQWDQRGAGKTFHKNGKAGTGPSHLSAWSRMGSRSRSFCANTLVSPSFSWAARSVALPGP